MVTTSALRNSRTHFCALEMLLQDGLLFLQLYRKRSAMQIDVWESQCGSPNNHCYASARLVALLFIFPKDFGGHHRDGPALPWALQELRQLQGVSDARRAAAFLCRLADSEYRRPLGFLSNMDTFCSQLYDGWPSFSFTEQSLVVYDGPLPKRSPCQSAHTSFKGLMQENDFISSSTVSLGVFLLGTDTAVDCRVHRSQLPWGWRLLCKSGTDSRRALTSLLPGLRLLLPGAHSLEPGILVISPGYSCWSMLHLVLWTSTNAAMQLFLWTLWLLCRSLCLQLCLHLPHRRLRFPPLRLHLRGSCH